MLKLVLMVPHFCIFVQLILPCIGAYIMTHYPADHHPNTPALRFPEFRNDPPWQVKKLGEVGELVNGLSGKNALDFGESGSKFVTYLQVYNSSEVKINECKFVLIKEGESQNKLCIGDVLFTTSSETPLEVGYSSVITSLPEDPVYLNSFCFALRPTWDLLKNPYFSKFIFRANIYRNEVIKIAQGVTRYNISKNKFIEIPIPLPSLAEQEKIAGCLSALDALITAQDQQLASYRQLKRGLMQQLFPSTVEAA